MHRDPSDLSLSLVNASEKEKNFFPLNGRREILLSPSLFIVVDFLRFSPFHYATVDFLSFEIQRSFHGEHKRIKRCLWKTFESQAINGRILQRIIYPSNRFFLTYTNPFFFRGFFFFLLPTSAKDFCVWELEKDSSVFCHSGRCTTREYKSSWKTIFFFLFTAALFFTLTQIANTQQVVLKSADFNFKGVEFKPLFQGLIL